MLDLWFVWLPGVVLIAFIIGGLLTVQGARHEADKRVREAYAWGDQWKRGYGDMYQRKQGALAALEVDEPDVALAVAYLRGRRVVIPSAASMLVPEDAS